MKQVCVALKCTAQPQRTWHIVISERSLNGSRRFLYACSRAQTTRALDDRSSYWYS